MIKTFGYEFKSPLKKYCFKAQKSSTSRVEAVEISLRERRHLPSPIIDRDLSSKKVPHSAEGQGHQHRRVSIFNPLTRESLPSVIQLSLSKPMPPRARQLVFPNSAATTSSEAPTATTSILSTQSHHTPVLSSATFGDLDSKSHFKSFW